MATAEYYKFLNQAVNDRYGGWDIAETLIAGMNFGNIEALLHQHDWSGLARYMQGKVDSLVAGGADILLCASNTLHKPLEEMVTIPDAISLIHIVDPTGAAMQAQGLTKVALFGTRPTMQMDYLKRRYYEKFGIEAIVPTDAEQTAIDDIIFNELVMGIIRDESKARYLQIAERMRAQDGVQGVILGCTEIFLLMDQPDAPDLPMFNTAKLHCEAAVQLALAETML